jgi:hypothetical protein
LGRGEGSGGSVFLFGLLFIEDIPPQERVMTLPYRMHPPLRTCSSDKQQRIVGFGLRSESCR